jgi:hypothetical protein
MASTSTSATSSTSADKVVLPTDRVLQQASKIAIEQDRPIMLDYFTDSLNGKAFIGQHNDTKERLLIKSSDEYTSMITKIFKVDECYIVLTENSLYVVSTSIKARSISS